MRPPTCRCSFREAGMPRCGKHETSGGTLGSDWSRTLACERPARATFVLPLLDGAVGVRVPCVSDAGRGVDVRLTCSSVTVVGTCFVRVCDLID